MIGIFPLLYAAIVLREVLDLFDLIIVPILSANGGWRSARRRDRREADSDDLVKINTEFVNAD